MEIGSEKWKQLIIDGARDFDIHVDCNQARQFVIHALELLQWNRKINLTAITDPKEVAVKHFLDSIIPGHMIEPDATLLDIGSGGGFPGIPMKIMEPSLAVTLIDASRKKVNFLKHMIRTLKLEKVEARHVRAEDFIKERKVQNSFDVVVSRALASIENLVTLAVPLLKRGGTIIALKGPELHKEIEAVCPQVAQNNGVMEIADIRFSVKFKRYSLPHLGLQRAIIALRIFS